jgi:hypothetical protein
MVLALCWSLQLYTVLDMASQQEGLCIEPWQPKGYLLRVPNVTKTETIVKPPPKRLQFLGEPCASQIQEKANTTTNNATSLVVPSKRTEKCQTLHAKDTPWNPPQ